MRTKEVTERLGISKSLLYKYCKDFNLNPVKNDKEQLEFSEMEVNLLERILTLRNDANGIDTIQRKLNLNEENMQEISRILPDNIQEIEEASQALISRLDSIETSLLNTLDDKFTNVLILAQEYSKNQYLLGESKAELRAEKEKTELIKQGYERDISQLNKELTKKEMELENQRIELLKKHSELEKLTEENNKSFWQKLLNSFGK